MKCFGGLFSASLLGTALGAGFTTHMSVPERMRDWFDSSAYPEYDDIVAKHWDALQAGSPFPDYYFLCDNDDAAEYTHWPPYQEIMANYLREKYPKPWDEDTEKLVAFMLGIVNHYIADLHWHGLSKVPFGEGFIRTLGAMSYECGGSLCREAHDAADTGGEFIAGQQLELDYINEGDWYVPANDMAEIFALSGYPTITAESITKCGSIFKLGAWAIAKFGHIVYPLVRFTRECPWMAEDYLDYYIGGVDDMAVWSGDMQYRFIDWLEQGPPDNIPAFALSDDGDGRFPNRPASDFMASLFNELRELDGLVCTVPDGRGYRLTMCGDMNDASLRTKVVTAMLRALGLSEEETVQSVLELRLAGHGLESRAGASLFSPDSNPPMPGNIFGGVKASRKVKELWTKEGKTKQEYFGRAIATGDYNSDGVTDVAVGAPGYSTKGLFQRGAVYVDMSGNSDSLAFDTVRSPAWKRSRFGASIATLDFNCDGTDDLAVGSPSYGYIPVPRDQDWELNYPGRVSIYFGGPDGLSTDPDVIITGTDPMQGFGEVILSGDLDGNTCTGDLLISAPHATDGDSHQHGAVYAFLASEENSRASSFTTLDAAWSLLGSEPFQFLGRDMATLPRAGSSAYIILGAPAATVDGMSSVGRVLIYEFGSSTPVLSVVGDERLGEFGRSVSASASTPHGPALVAVASTGQSEGKKFAAGRVFLLRLDEVLAHAGRSDVPVSEMAVQAVVVGDELDSHAGLGVGGVTLADFNGDGRTDLLVSQALADRDGGEVFAWSDVANTLEGEVTRLWMDSEWSVEGGTARARFASVVHFTDDGNPTVFVAAPREGSDGSMAGTVRAFRFE
eukprot:Rmarinus@m.521